ncbi:MAG: ABC transporter permease [Rhodobacteraceae bacterium]|nr:ABC transporter permease [Paracoccaceae bacterium]
MMSHSPFAEALARIAFLVKREFRAIWRDTRSRTILILPPIMQLFLFAYAATFEVNNIPLAVLNEDMGLASRDLVADFTASPAFTSVARLTSAQEIGPLIDDGDALMALRIPQDFSRKLLAGKSPEIQVIVDGRQSNTALMALSYINDIVERFSREHARTSGIVPSPPQLVTRAWFNPNMDSKWFIVPGLVATLTMIIATVITALSIARERELGTFEQLLVTPLRPPEILIGKIVPAAVLGMGEGLTLGLLGVLFFDIPVRGDVLLLVLGLAVFLLSVTSFGLMISALTSTQQQAQIAAFCFIMPAVILSGFTTPVGNMPETIQWLTLFNPLRYMLEISRGVFLQDMPMSVVFEHVWPMAIIGVAAASAATWLFSRKLQ